jgi:hypothetical protein
MKTFLIKTNSGSFKVNSSTIELACYFIVSSGRVNNVKNIINVQQIINQ